MGVQVTAVCNWRDVSRASTWVCNWLVEQNHLAISSDKFPGSEDIKNLLITLKSLQDPLDGVTVSSERLQ